MSMLDFPQAAFLANSLFSHFRFVFFVYKASIFLSVSVIIIQLQATISGSNLQQSPSTEVIVYGNHHHRPIVYRNLRHRRSTGIFATFYRNRRHRTQQDLQESSPSYIVDIENVQHPF